ncbi:MAG TPA: M1 family aminopeptidase [Symbiobacteriaceae bacterium]|jgi:hypothetical protein|nr:M1 family aminopeptidase [Symbiobacteriaceae bacterium]
MRRLIACLLLLVMPVLSACSDSQPTGGATPPSSAPAPVVLRDGLTWTGTEIAGVKYFVRRTERATVHYALPTYPDTAELVANRVKAYYEKQADFDRAPLLGHLDIWLVPPSHKWPTGAPPAESGLFAVAPGLVLMRDPTTRGGTLTTQMDFGFAAASYEPAGSPIYAQEWLQWGMGVIRGQEWNFFPQQFWGMDAGRTGKQLLQDAAERSKYFSNAWIVFSALIFDSFGFRWSSFYEGDPAALTPEGALKWAMGTDDVDEAVARYAKRLSTSRQATGSRPDLSPDRMTPELAQLPPGPGPNPNHSPHAYKIDAELDAATATVSGDLRLTWQNGEGIPLDTLYFSVWANTERHGMYGGSTNIEQVTVDGRPAAFEAKGIDLKVALGRQVAPGERVEVSVRFVTHLPANLEYELGLVDAERFYLTQFYPILAVLDDRGWNLHALSYTGGDPYSEHADYDVTLTVPAGFVVGATGRQVSRTENEKTWTYRYEARQVPAWSAAGGLNWIETTAEVGGITVRLLNHDKVWHDHVMPAAVESLTYLQEQLGPFPLPELVVVRGYVKLPGIAAASDTDGGGWYKNGLVNSIAGQWFGTHVGNDQWTEAWLDEGLSKYMEMETARALNREYQITGVRLIDRPRYGRVTQNGMDFLLSRNRDLLAGDYAANFFAALEKQIGSEAMNALLRQWVRQYGGRTATGADLIRLAEEFSGPLGPLLEEHAVDPSDRKPYKRIAIPGYDD